MFVFFISWNILDKNLNIQTSSPILSSFVKVPLIFPAFFRNTLVFGPDQKHHHVQEIAAPLTLLFLLLSESPLNSSNLSPSPLCFLGERRVRARRCQAAWSWGFCSSRSPRCCSCSLSHTLRRCYESNQIFLLTTDASPLWAPLCSHISTNWRRSDRMNRPTRCPYTHAHAHTLPVFLFKFNALWKTFYLLGFYSYPPNKQIKIFFMQFASYSSGPFTPVSHRRGALPPGGGGAHRHGNTIRPP